MENEGTYLANGGGCTGMLIADEARNSSECLSRYMLAQWVNKASG